MFMREFPVITSAESIEKLRLRLNNTDLEQFGEAFIPEFVYDVIKRLPRFSSMRRGHQQDAEEFLGFLLAELHEECAQVIRSVTSNEADKPTSPNKERAAAADGWLEVGPKQRAAITRSSGTIDVETPITKIFGGKLRSELRIPGLKNSVTLEPYQPLQLDIGAPNVNNITDALKALTHSETLQGDFNSPRGPNVSAVKQVFIETLPPVLILHLKRFQYDNAGGTQKIWKRIGYPLELELPKEVFPPSKRGALALRGAPRYRLIGVVYHHGKNASGGGEEWIRMDDTIIRRVRSEGVAEGGSEEDPKVLAKALEQHKRDQSAGRNIFEAMGGGPEDEEDGENEGPWSHVNGSGAQEKAKKWPGTGTANGTATPSEAGKQTPTQRERGGLRDNKVAYILFYQQIKN
ncbi:hypothetical protein H2199_005414 [Coniosporium tulheliwenetii]|uniref:Uncharacterized protein n=1 Tax=Coniosporium tulheliwenetii TaxID=3383036 RepID=A0ACC2Z1H2_9PEZI|nr:hypothetical protein H2199_005414 [Cladosporium sp. JES 115]